jgi:hypothetical protein
MPSPKALTVSCEKNLRLATATPPDPKIELALACFATSCAIASEHIGLLASLLMSSLEDETLEGLPESHFFKGAILIRL